MFLFYKLFDFITYKKELFKKEIGRDNINI